MLIFALLLKVFFLYPLKPISFLFVPRHLWNRPNEKKKKIHRKTIDDWNIRHSHFDSVKERKSLLEMLSVEWTIDNIGDHFTTKHQQLLNLFSENSLMAQYFNAWASVQNIVGKLKLKPFAEWKYRRKKKKKKRGKSVF